MALDEKKLQELIGKMLGDVGAAMGAALVLLGDKFGLYKTLASAGPLSAADLASRTGTVERYVREWAAAEAAAGYINYDPASARYSISPEQALLLADENGPAFFQASTRSPPLPYATNQKLPRRFAMAAASDGTSTTRAFFAAPKDSSAPAMRRIWSPNGSPRLRASRKNSNAARTLPTSDAATVLR